VIGLGSWLPYGGVADAQAEACVARFSRSLYFALLRHSFTRWLPRRTHSSADSSDLGRKAAVS
jgi:hypothetical protein